MTNDNCLEGIKCPRCGNEERLLIVATILADVTDGGADVADGSDMHWDDASMTRCPECDADGPLRRFQVRPGLPPDPDVMNDERAGWAGQAIATFMLATGSDREDALADLLADLMHWCDRRGFSFAAELERGRNHYETETLAEPAEDEATEECKQPTTEGD
jgi:hypothetical protein